MRWPRIVEVDDAPLPAVAYEDGSELVVEVDAKLKGRARASAIAAAVRSHKRGFGSLVLIPIALYLWEPIKHVTRNHPGAALGTTAVGAIAAAIVIPALQNDNDGKQFSAPLPVTVIATITVSQRPPTPAATRPTATPQRTVPLATSPPRAMRSPSTPPVAPRPSRSARPTAALSPSASALEEAATVAMPPDVPSEAAPPPAAGDQPPSPPPTTFEPDPEVTEASQRGCLLGVHLSPLLDACILG